MNSNEQRCDWKKKDGTCQFSTFNPPIVHLESGQAYCPLHTPLEARERSERLAYNCFSDAVNHGITNFDGACLPADKDFRPVATDGNVVTFRDCTFVGKATLDLSGVEAGASVVFGTPTHMGGRIVVLLSFGKLVARKCIFAETIELVSRVNGDTYVDFFRSHFIKGVEVKAPMEGVWNFDRSHFDGVFTFQPEQKHFKPSSEKANISFFRSKFSRSATPRQAEGLYRHWREWFAGIGDKDNEAVFYALEKRSQRRGLPLGLTRGFSAGYDWLSAYGQSFARPLSWFIGLQVLAGLIYASGSPRYALRPSWDGTIPAFTLAQLVKPFELLGVRANPQLVVDVVGANVEPGWAIGAFLHSMISLFLFTLFILAVRWRFRRS